MKVEEAALHLERLYGIVSEEYKRALDVADNALAKQIPKKRDKLGCCKCGCMVANCNYCPKCGQKIDRSDW